MQSIMQVWASTLVLLLSVLSARVHATQTSSIRSEILDGTPVGILGAWSVGVPTRSAAAPTARTAWLKSWEKGHFMEGSLAQIGTRSSVVLPAQATVSLPSAVNSLRKARSTYSERRELEPLSVTDQQVNMTATHHQDAETNSTTNHLKMTPTVLPASGGAVIVNLPKVAMSSIQDFSVESNQGGNVGNSDKGDSVQQVLLPLPSAKSLAMEDPLGITPIIMIVLVPIMVVWAAIPAVIKVAIVVGPFACCFGYCTLYGAVTTATRPTSLKKVKYILPVLEEVSKHVRGYTTKEPVEVSGTTKTAKAVQKFALGMFEGISVQEGRFIAAVSGKHKDLKTLLKLEKFKKPAPKELDESEDGPDPEDNARAANWKKHGCLAWWKSQEEFYLWAESGEREPDERIPLLEITNIVNNSQDVIVTRTDTKNKRSTEHFFVFASKKEAKKFSDNLEVLLMKLKVLKNIGKNS